MRQKNWFWGIILIVGAAVLIASQLGLLSYKIGGFTIIATIVLIATLIQSLFGRSIFGSVFSLALLTMIWEGPLGIEQLDTGTILIAALLIWAGLSILFSRHHHIGAHVDYHVNHHHNVIDAEEDFDEDTETITEDAADAEEINVSIRMTQSVRYIQATNLKTANIYVSMAGAKIYFDDVDIPSGTATINLDASLSGVELYIPDEWHLINQLDSSLSGLDESGSRVDADGPTVYLKGKLNLGGLTIIYI